VTDERTYAQWIERKRAEGPGPELTDAVMMRIRRAGAPAARGRRWAAAAVWGLAGMAGLWRAVQVLAPFITG